MLIIRNRTVFKRRARPARKPWIAFSAALAGGGIQGGRVVGSSNTLGGEPNDNPKTPQDVLATMYRHLGIDASVTLQDLNGRPFPILPSGTPVDELFG